MADELGFMVKSWDAEDRSRTRIKPERRRDFRRGTSRVYSGVVGLAQREDGARG